MNVTLHAFWVGCLHSDVWFMMPNSYFTKDTKCSKTHPSAKSCVCMVWYVDRLISAFSFKTFRSGDGSTSFLQFSFLNILTAMDRHLLMCLRIPPNQYECCLIAEYFWVGNISRYEGIGCRRPFCCFMDPILYLYLHNCVLFLIDFCESK